MTNKLNLYNVVTYAGFEWYIIGIDGDAATLLAKDDDFGVYEFDEESNDYESSSIRLYLNSSVLNKLIDNEANLLETCLTDCNSIKEQVYLLSIEEAEKLPELVKKFSRSWWLRSPGDGSDFAAFVNFVGDINSYGYHVFNDFGSVRPVIKVKISDLLISNDTGKSNYGIDWKIRNDYAWGIVEDYEDTFYVIEVLNSDTKYYKVTVTEIYTGGALSKSYTYPREFEALDEAMKFADKLNWNSKDSDNLAVFIEKSRS